MIRSRSAISLLVPDYDQGLAFFKGALGFTVEEDVLLRGDKRWVVVAPVGGAGCQDRFGCSRRRAATQEGWRSDGRVSRVLPHHR